MKGTYESYLWKIWLGRFYIQPILKLNISKNCIIVAAFLYPAAQKVSTITTSDSSQALWCLCLLLPVCYGTGCVILAASSSLPWAIFLWSCQCEQRMKGARLWEPKQLHAGQVFLPLVEHWCRLPRDIVLHQSWKVYKNILVQTQIWPFFQKEVGLKTSWGFACIV